MNARHWKCGRTAVFVTGTIASALLTCSLAHAQAWLPDREYTEGPGFKAGDLEIHPGIAARAGWDSNVYASDGRGGARRGNEEISSGIVAVTPHLNISTRGRQRLEGGEETVTAPPKLRLNAGLAGSFLYYFEDAAPDPNVEASVDVLLGIMPERVVSGEVFAGYDRTIRPFTERGADNYVRNSPAAGGKLRFRSRGGVLNASVGFRPEWDFFEAQAFDFLNNTTYTVPFSMAWKFLPHTALLYDAELSIRDYMESPVSGNVLFTDSNVFRNRLGVNGALTNTVALRAMAGAAFGFYDALTGLEDPMTERDYRFDEYQEPIGQLLLTWQFGGRRNSLSVGYEHEVQPSYVGAWVKRDRGDVQLALNPLSMIALRFEVGGGRYYYGNMVGAGDADGDGEPDAVPLGEGGDSSRDDLRLDAAVRAEYRATNWLAFMVDATVVVSSTDFAYATDTTRGIIVDPADFTKFQVFGGVRAFY